MAHITEMVFWDDIGYTIDSQFVSTQELPTPTLTITREYHPSPGRLFSQVRLSYAYDSCMCFQYAKITYSLSTGTKTFYFWVTNVSLQYDNEYPVTVIDLQMDLWRTYIEHATFGYGLVQNRPLSVFRPIQPMSWILRKPFDYQLMRYAGQATGLYWVCLNYVTKADDEKISAPIAFWFPIDKENPSFYHRLRIGKDFEHICITLQDLIDGSWDEKLGLSPQTVTSCFISPYPPFNISGYRDGIVIVDTTYSWLVKGVTLGTSPYGGVVSTVGEYYEHKQSLPSVMSTSETDELMITDLNAVPIASLPYGWVVKDYTVRNVVTQVSCALEIRFDGIDSHAVGTCITIPLPAIDITSNSWSDYVYSGQRDYEKEQRRIANEQALVSGITSAISGSSSSAVMASLGERKKVGGDVAISDSSGTSIAKVPSRTVSGMTPGVAGVLTAGFGIVASIADYGLNLMYNDQLQNAEDQLQAKQLDSVITSGSGWDWVYYGREIGLIHMKPDEYSLSRFQSDIKWNGIRCSEPTEDCTALIKAGGPLRISNLQVKGDIPVQAKQYIKDRLSQGVYILTPEP